MLSQHQRRLAHPASADIGASAHPAVSAHQRNIGTVSGISAYPSVSAHPAQYRHGIASAHPADRHVSASARRHISASAHQRIGTSAAHQRHIGASAAHRRSIGASAQYRHIG
jgi:hypothetical protein